MKCGKLKYLLLVLLLLSSVQVFSLSQSEEEILPTLDAQTLTLIILEYEKALIGLENLINEREKEILKKEQNLKERSELLEQQEIRLIERESAQEEKDKLLEIQENLFQKSLTMHQREIKKTKLLYGGGGLLTGLIVGAIISN